MLLTKIQAIFRSIIAMTDSWKRFFMSITLLLLISGGAIVYQATSLYLTGNSEYYSSLAKRLQADDKITPVMDAFRDKIGSDRLLVAELHDGKKNTTGVRFAYMSGTYESDDRGLTRVLLEFQNIPTSIFAGLWGPLLDGKCVMIDDQSPHEVARAQFHEYGANRTMMCPIQSPGDSSMIGILFATWRVDPTDFNLDKVNDEMEKASYIISGLIYEAKE
jgi:hypothetical protein